MQVALRKQEIDKEWLAYYAIEANGEQAGEGWLTKSEPCSVKVYVDETHRGHGVGTAAVRLLTDEAFARAGIDSLVIHVKPEQAGVFSRAGFAAVRMVTYSDVEGPLEMRLTREGYDARRRRAWLMDVYDAMADYDAGNPHQIHHNAKVHSFARQIALREGVDDNMLFLIEVAALTHDIGIKPAVEQTGACPGPLQEKLGPPIAEVMLTELGLPAPVIRRVCFLIGHHHTTEGVAGIDWRILLEADFLVNMIEGKATDEGIDACRQKVFRTREGLRLIEQIRPARQA